ncbi:MAG: hypothetical protein R3C01_01120 [Planctomycetaceae bacterium]
MLLVVDGWALWRTQKPIDNGGARNSSAEHSLYRQRIPDPNAHLVLNCVMAINANPFQAIADDGTLIAIWGSDNVRWIHPDGTVKDADTKRGSHRMGAYPDGIHVTEWNDKHDQLIDLFIPFRGEALDFENQIEIRSRESRNWTAAPVRFGNVMVWSTPKELHTVNVKSGQRTSVPLDKKGEIKYGLKDSYVTAFDGEWALLGGGIVVDVKTGNRIADRWDDKRLGLFATHKGIGYRVHEGNLEAVDVVRPDQPPVVLSKAPYQPMARTASGWLLWTGQEWKRVPWYVSP